MEPVGEVGCGVHGRSGAGKGDLHGEEVPDATRYGQVHRVELVDEALQIIDQYVVPDGGYFQKGEELYP